MASNDDIADVGLIHHNETSVNQIKENMRHLTSTGSIGSQSSIGSSTLSTIQGLTEINKIILGNNVNSRKELLNNRDNKVYSYKLNQLISIIKYNVNKKTAKSKKSVVTKLQTSGHSKKT